MRLRLLLVLYACNRNGISIDLNPIFKEWISKIVNNAIQSNFSLYASKLPFPDYFTDPPFEWNHRNILSGLPVNILLLGDSLSRNMVDDYCKKNEYHFVANWATGVEYFNQRYHSTLCESFNIRIAHFHIFGSKPRGPYDYNFNNSKDDPYVDTEVRVPLAINQYRAKYGAPDFIIYRTDAWDLGPRTYRPGKLWKQFQVDEANETLHANQTMKEFFDNNIRQLDKIHEILPDVILGTHTIPTWSVGLHLFHLYEETLREISSSTDFFLYDWKKLVECDSLIPDNKYLRDFAHPDTTLNNAFTQFLISTMQAWKQHKFYQHRNRLHQKLVPIEDKHYVLEFNTQREVTREVLHFLQISTSLKVSDVDPSTADLELINNMPLIQPYPDWCKNDTLVRPAGSKTIYWLINGCKRVVFSSTVFFNHGWEWDQVISILATEQAPDFLRIRSGDDLTS